MQEDQTLSIAAEPGVVMGLVSSRNEEVRVISVRWAGPGASGLHGQRYPLWYVSQWF